MSSAEITDIFLDVWKATGALLYDKKLNVTKPVPAFNAPVCYRTTTCLRSISWCPSPRSYPCSALFHSIQPLLHQPLNQAYNRTSKVDAMDQTLRFAAHKDAMSVKITNLTSFPCYVAKACQPKNLLKVNLKEILGYLNERQNASQAPKSLFQPRDSEEARDEGGDPKDAIKGTPHAKDTEEAVSPNGVVLLSRVA
ncbi:hypothetical protein BJ508DRAFT_127661 [Ascobolus immersus RN42]|uniref:Uncharacterized protein n=1 Tax=Ascobolus immersus RN42 TaxID=1160509 RepID=A0A3N4I8J5_ASCIM|nr:hypothetical protein BJ508DRAFT_127661 [Ascobolus immersus RN42]